MHTILSADQTVIAYERTGAGTPLLLVHGTNANHTQWNLALPYLNPHFTVYTMDRRGRGQSGDAPDYAIQREFEDVAALAESIDGPVDILGHSFGAACVLGAAQHIPNLRRLLLYEPPMLQEQQSPQRTALLDRMEQLLAQGENAQVVIMLLRDLLNVPQPMLDRIQTVPNWTNQVAAAHTIPRELRQSHCYAPNLADLKRITVPTQFLLGEQSPAFFRQTTEKLQAHVPDSQITVLPGQQHSAMLTAPEAFAAEVVKFLTTLT
ncbi:MAG TPA: alpha/beta hydrolase [Anaerolineae bacterium]|nr:alpha/beta hydrolase [Anaerolineae bacterium]